MKMLRTCSRWRADLCALLVVGVLGGPAAVAADATGAAAAAPATMTDSQREAAAILKSMSEYLARLPSFSVKFRDGYDVVQASGQKIEFGEARTVTLARPDRLRVEEITSEGRKDLALFDGKTVTVFDGDKQVYAQAPQPGSIDDALVYFVRDLKMRMPLALLMTTRLPDELPSRVTDIDYVEQTEVLGVAAHHIAGRTANVDFQFWVSQGDRPLPLRVVITYRNEPGQPQFWANLADWNTAPPIAKSLFEFTPSKDARKIGFAASARPASAAAKAEVLP
jgi:hypothetical protein